MAQAQPHRRTDRSANLTNFATCIPNQHNHHPSSNRQRSTARQLRRHLGAIISRSLALSVVLILLSGPSGAEANFFGDVGNVFKNLFSNGSAPGADHSFPPTLLSASLNSYHRPVPIKPTGRPLPLREENIWGWFSSPFPIAILCASGNRARPYNPISIPHNINVTEASVKVLIQFRGFHSTPSALCPHPQPRPSPAGAPSTNTSTSICVWNDSGTGSGPGARTHICTHVYTCVWTECGSNCGPSAVNNCGTCTGIWACCGAGCDC